MIDRIESDQTSYAGAGDLLCLHFDPPKAPERTVVHGTDPYLSEPDVDVQLHLAGAAGLWHETA